MLDEQTADWEDLRSGLRAAIDLLAAEADYGTVVDNLRDLERRASLRAGAAPDGASPELARSYAIIDSGMVRIVDGVRGAPPQHRLSAFGARARSRLRRP